MLVLSRREQETIRIGDDIVITVVRIDSSAVRIGVDAPKDMLVLRGELNDKRGEVGDGTERVG